MKPGRWSRTKYEPLSTSGFGPEVTTMYASTTEYLDLDAVVERYMEALEHRGDAGLRDKLDHAINGTLGDLIPPGQERADG